MFGDIGSWWRNAFSKCSGCIRVIFSHCIVYLYSAQYLHVLQDSKRYMTHRTVQVQSNSQITDIPETERQRLKDDHVSTSLRFLNLPLGTGPNDREPLFEGVIRATMCLPVPGYKPTFSMFLGEWVTRQATVT